MASKAEHASIRYLTDQATAVGEVVAVSADQLVIAGTFSPGMGTYELRPGARVFVLNEDDGISAVRPMEADL